MDESFPHREPYYTAATYVDVNDHGSNGFDWKTGELIKLGNRGFVTMLAYPKSAIRGLYEYNKGFVEQNYGYLYKCYKVLLVVITTKLNITNLNNELTYHILMKLQISTFHLMVEA